MKKVAQKTQFTFRIEGSYRQLIENAFSEEEARRQLAHRLLEEEGREINEASISEISSAKLRLVNMR